MQMEDNLHFGESMAVRYWEQFFDAELAAEVIDLLAAEQRARRAKGRRTGGEGASRASERGLKAKRLTFRSSVQQKLGHQMSSLGSLRKKRPGHPCCWTLFARPPHSPPQTKQKRDAHRKRVGVPEKKEEVLFRFHLQHSQQLGCRVDRPLTGLGVRC